MMFRAVRRLFAFEAAQQPKQHTSNPRLSSEQLGRVARIPRKYKAAAVSKLANGFGVELDGNAVKTPKGMAFTVPAEQLALSVAAEFNSQEKHIIPDSMPMMTMSCTALDVVGDDKIACIKRLMPYLETDTICFLSDYSSTDAWDRALAKEMEVWRPIRKWFEDQYGEVDVTFGINPPLHPEATIARVQESLKERDQWDLAALEVSTRYAKSLICAMKFLADDITPEQVMKWALLEENFQIERCGLVEGDHDVFQKDMLRWLTAAKEFKIIIDKGSVE